MPLEVLVSVCNREGCRQFSCYTPGTSISQDYLLRRRNLVGKETLQRLTALAVALEDKK